MSKQVPNMKVIASTTGMITNTTTPVRKPSDRRLTAITMSTASASTLMNSVDRLRDRTRLVGHALVRRMPTGCADVFHRRVGCQ